MSTIRFNEFKAGKVKQMLADMDKLNKLSKDNSDIFTAMIKWHGKIVDDNWDTNGRFWGKSWQGLTAKYKKWKTNQGLSGKADLMLQDQKLRRAATGKSGDLIKVITPTKCSWAIDTNEIPYARRHQWGDSSYRKLSKFSAMVPKYKSGDTHGKAKYKAKIEALQHEYKHGMPQRPYFMMYNGTIHPKIYIEYSKLIKAKIDKLLPKD